MSEMPKEIGVCAFVDGTFEVYPDSPNVPPATKYVRADLCTPNEEALEALDWMVREMLFEIEYKYDRNYPSQQVKYDLDKSNIEQAAGIVRKALSGGEG